MRYLIIGAGAVGGAIGARLAEAGQDVVLVARGAQYGALRERGLRFEAPDGVHVHRLPVADGPGALGTLRADDVLVLCVKTQDSAAALAAWGAAPVEGGGTAAARLPLVCAQNGVESERLALRTFQRVYAMCVWLPATFVEPGVVRAAGAPLTGILHLGRYPAGSDDTARAISADLERGRFAAPVVDDVMRWKYAKLLANLANAVEAVSGVLTDEDGIALFRRARAEGEAVLAAAGIAYTGRDEEKKVRADRITFEPFDGSPRGGGSTWQSLDRGAGSVEVDYLNGEIGLLGRLHGVPTPVNDVLQERANEAARLRRPAGATPIAELVAAVDARA
ncbi:MULTISPECIES: 2-dehydropantoate 2-reductase N-terminal domain-containing protein [unclassified Streptomyces]|uniref:ketopantoate reductase family protein n=1 Tax=unclassified Streptomyces TaxID=2593676 RepID=UPI000DBAA69B|nr:MULTISPECIES: 2-dehydropantoate 2-reductase N-terminal domain-containing protein [unclassified Streptomyces]MYT73934.1 ketopantoate reductase family protein [Streptomyces sp. SID8367]RAJ89348.1 2-dehydropantoate 2-reductase [Streptomyces sp. PsTaAH-137]